MKSIPYRQDSIIRKVCLILSTILFILGFWLLYKSIPQWYIMHIVGFIGLGWSFILRKRLEQEDKENNAKGQEKKDE